MAALYHTITQHKLVDPNNIHTAAVSYGAWLALTAMAIQTTISDGDQVISIRPAFTSAVIRSPGSYHDGPDDLDLPRVRFLEARRETLKNNLDKSPLKDALPDRHYLGSIPCAANTVVPVALHLKTKMLLIDGAYDRVVTPESKRPIDTR